MSREIKFRAWNGKVKEFAYFHAGVDAYEMFRRRWADVDGELDDSEVCYDFEQYTGLTDKKGKEIYEGDILGGIFEGCYIGWCDITKSFELFNCYERYCMACDGDILWCELSDSDIGLEVIGNVHENPELLGGEK